MNLSSNAARHTHSIYPSHHLDPRSYASCPPCSTSCSAFSCQTIGTAFKWKLGFSEWLGAAFDEMASWIGGCPVHEKGQCDPDCKLKGRRIKEAYKFAWMRLDDMLQDFSLTLFLDWLWISDMLFVKGAKSVLQALLLALIRCKMNQKSSRLR